MGRTLHPYYCWESSVPSFICDEIVKEYNSIGTFTDGFISDETLNGDKNVRKSNIIFSHTNWINAMMCGYIFGANSINFKYELSEIDKERFQFSKYVKGDYYHLHRDWSTELDDLPHTRKLSATLQLSDSDDYEGGDLLIDMFGYYVNNNKHDIMHTMNRSKGSVIVFDSRMPHEITPVTKGTRYSLVKWFHGDKPLR